jgi:Glyoxalase-like domain
MLELDHLLWGAPDLDEAAELFREMTGVTAAGGGSHPGHGSRNQLAALDEGRYFEIIAPDPLQDLSHGRGAELAALKGPGLYAFALRSRDLPQLAASMRAAGGKTDGPHTMGRATPGGGRIEWSILYLTHPAFAGTLHFALDWGTTLHPSTVTPKGCTLKSFAILRRDPAALREIYRSLGVPIGVHGAAADGFLAVLGTPMGDVVLREA